MTKAARMHAVNFCLKLNKLDLTIFQGYNVAAFAARLCSRRNRFGPCYFFDNNHTGGLLSNDPGKKGSNFFCCGAIRFSHIEMFSFLRRECINLQKGCLRKKMYLNSTFKGCIFVLKHFDQSQELQTMAKKCSQFYMIRTYDFCFT